MSKHAQPLARAVKIIVVVGLMAGVVWVVGERIRTRLSARASGASHGSVLEQVRHQHVERPPLSSLGVEPRVDAVVRDLALVYNRRAYAGAPPTIPHELETVGIGDKACTTCHEQGGYVEKYTAYAPVTPHPDYVSCTQCHVPATTEELFRESDWASAAPAKIKRPALPGSPPPIPHTMQLRENCISCHGGPAAPREVRTSHPERENCIQCHVPVEVPGLFERPLVAQVVAQPVAPAVGTPE